MIDDAERDRWREQLAPMINDYLASLESAGVDLVIHPVSLLRIALGAIERGLDALKEHETLQPVVADMQTRARLYELLDYEAYTAFDTNVFNFSLEKHFGA